MKPQRRRCSLVRVLTRFVVGNATLPSPCSTTRQEIPRQPNSIANAKPLGPPPAIRTGYRLTASVMASEAMTEAVRRYPVLIAGGGPSGLALAIELGWRGISCLVVEQGDGSVAFPTTNLVNTRTSEHLRRWGFIDQVRFAGFPKDFPRNYIFVTGVFGRELARFEHPANGDPRYRSPYSPEGRIWCPKLFLDPVLQRQAKSLRSVQVRFN